MISGDQEIDVKDWKANTMYKDCKEDDDIAQWFWKVCAGLRILGAGSQWPWRKCLPLFEKSAFFFGDVDLL